MTCGTLPVIRTGTGQIRTGQIRTDKIRTDKIMRHQRIRPARGMWVWG